MSWTLNPWLQWILGLVVVLFMLVMPVFAGHGGGPFALLLVFGWGAWWPVLAPASLGAIALLVVTPFCEAPHRNWVSLIGLALAAAALGFTQGFAGDAVLIPILLYAFLVVVALVAAVNAMAIVLERRDA
jgi:hypothetical protein